MDLTPFFSVTVTMLNGTTLASPLVTYDYYDANGNLAEEVLPDGIATNYSYDSQNRMTGETQTNASGAVLFSETYTLDADGNRTLATETEMQPDGTMASITTSWGYDDDGRLIAEDISSALSGVSETEAWTFDQDGNQLTRTTTTPNSNGTFTTDTTTNTYNGDNQLTESVDSVTGDATFNSYDAAGNMNESQTFAPAELGSNGQPTFGAIPISQTTYTYDLNNKMVGYSDGTTSATYVYDYQGNRVQETVSGVTTFHLIDDNNPTGYAKPLEVWTNATLQETYLIGSRVFGQVNSGGSVTYLLTDGHGSTRELVSSSGTIIATINYDALGNVLGVTYTPSNPPPTIFLYGGGGYYDPASGSYIQGARTYNPVTGRWMEADDPGNQIMTQPITNDLYLYCDANPINGTDPTGHDDSLMSNMAFGLAGQYQIQNLIGLGETQNYINGNVGYIYDAEQYDSTAVGVPFGAGKAPPLSLFANKPPLNMLIPGLGAGLNVIYSALNGNYWSALGYLGMAAFEVGSIPAGGEGEEIDAGLEAAEGFSDFASFDSLKSELGSAGDGNVWHHIVEQRASNVALFGEEAIHNTSNVIAVSREINQELANYYSSIRFYTNDQTVRMWLGTQSYQKQFSFGQEMLQILLSGGKLP